MAKIGKPLSPTESKIADLVSRYGHSNKIICRLLDMPETTVKAHMHNAQQKLGVHNRTQLALKLWGVLQTDESTIYETPSSTTRPTCDVLEYRRFIRKGSTQSQATATAKDHRPRDKAEE